MNLLVLAAGIIAVFTTLVHVIAGQIDPARPLLTSDLEPVAKATLMACWHIVSLALASSSLALVYASVDAENVASTMVWWIGLAYAAFAAVFVIVGWFFFGAKGLIKLPQWTLLLPIGVLAMFGAG